MGMTKGNFLHYRYLPDSETKVSNLDNIIVGEEHVPKGNVSVDNSEVRQVFHTLETNIVQLSTCLKNKIG